MPTPPMTRFIAADASTLIASAAAGAFERLRERFQSITITRLVKDEVAGRGERPGARELTAAMRAGWIRVAPTPPDTWGFAQLDPGEASTIALALQHEGALVLMDDKLGREQAAASGLDVMGLADLLAAERPVTQ